MRRARATLRGPDAEHRLRQSRRRPMDGLAARDCGLDERLLDVAQLVDLALQRGDARGTRSRLDAQRRSRLAGTFSLVRGLVRGRTTGNLLNASRPQAVIETVASQRFISAKFRISALSSV
jgi:hypothetical protein